MSQLLLHWLNSEVCLSERIDSFEHAFRNGYLLGELLYRFNQQRDFPFFLRKDTTLAQLNNFCRIENTLNRRLNIKGFDSQTAYDIVTGHVPTTVDILYKIKMKLDKIRVVVGTHPGKDSAPGTFVALADMPLRTQRPVFDASRSWIFEKSMRARLEGTNLALMRRHLQRFDDEKKRQEAYVEYLVLLDNQAKVRSFEEKRQRRIKAHAAAIEELQEWQEQGVQIWNRVKQLEDYRKEVIHRFHQQRKEKKEQGKVRKVEKERIHSQQEIEAFQVKLLRAGIRQPTPPRKPLPQTKNEEEEEDEAMYLLDAQGYEPMLDNSDLLTELPEKYDIPGEDLTQVNQFIAELKARKGNAEQQVDERDSRRKRFLSTRQAAFEENANGILASVSRTKCERDSLKMESSREEYLKILRHSKIFLENLYFRQQQEASREELDHKHRVKRTALQEQVKVEQKELAVRQLHHTVAALVEAEEAAQWQRKQDDIYEILQDIVDAAVATQAHTLLSDGLPSVSSLQEITDTVVQGSSALQHYLFGSGEWRTGSDKAHPGFDKSLTTAAGDALALLRDAAWSNKKPTKSSSPLFKYQVVLLGVPLSGKSTLAARLAAKYHLRVINAEALVNACANEERVAAALPLGELSDDVYVELILSEIRSISEENERRRFTCEDVEGRLATMTVEEKLAELYKMWGGGEEGLSVERMTSVARCADKLGRGEAALLEEANVALGQMNFSFSSTVSLEDFTKFFLWRLEGEDAGLTLHKIMLESCQELVPIEGWVLDGFPWTKAQAKLLEQALSGVDPEREAARTNETSTLSASPVQTRHDYTGLSAIDLALYLDTEPATVFRRADVAENNQLGERLMKCQRESEALQEWFTKFRVLRKPFLFDAEGEALGIEESFCQVDKLMNEVKELKDDIEMKRREQNEREKAVGKCKDVAAEWGDSDRPLLLPFDSPIVLRQVWQDSQADEERVDEIFERMYDELVSKGDTFEETLASERQRLLGFRETPECKAAGLAYHWNRALEQDKGMQVTRKDLKALASAVNSSLSEESAQIVVDKGADLKEALSLDILAQCLLPCVQTEEDFAEVAKQLEDRIAQCDHKEEPSSQSEEISNDNALNARAEADRLYKSYVTAEESYLSGVKSILASLRNLRDNGLLYWSNKRALFYTFLQRETSLQECADDLRSNFNALAMDCRTHPEVKAELFMRIEDFAGEVLKRTEERKEEAKKEIDMVISEGWVASQKARIATHFLALFRCELGHLRHVTDMMKLDVFAPEQDLTSFIVDTHKNGPDHTIKATLEQLQKIEIIDEGLSRAFSARLEQIATQAASWFADAEKRGEHQKQRLEAWTAERIEAERVAVERYCQYAKGKAAAGIPLP